MTRITNRNNFESSHGLIALEGGRDDPERPAGKVWLVGAGPGDPELLTRKAERLIQCADVILHDCLIGEAILAMAPPSAMRMNVGKRKGGPSVAQQHINSLLVALARRGLQVVRLKGGDPFIFGRGGEELLACREAGVTCEVVPGVSAAIAAAAGAGAPLTHRGLAQSVTFVTGQSSVESAELDLDWAALARPNHTLAVYMGLSTAPTIAWRLLAQGRSPSTPVLLVSRASLPGERRVQTTLGELAGVSAMLQGPAVLLIGETAALADPGDGQAAIAVLSRMQA
ncbi:MAG TPA: uroporphyrinogen-III C-methyltransferase [Caulobacteraceae bacterium]